MPFTPGDPNINRSGRPPKPRTMTLLLQQEVSKLDLATAIADALDTGSFTFPGSGRTIDIKDASELLAIWKFIYKTVDPPNNVGARQIMPPSHYEPPIVIEQPVAMDATAQDMIDMMAAAKELLYSYLSDEMRVKFLREWQERFQQLRQERLSTLTDETGDDYGTDQ